jgi:hypothetical protein
VCGAEIPAGKKKTTLYTVHWQQLQQKLNGLFNTCHKSGNIARNISWTDRPAAIHVTNQCCCKVCANTSLYTFSNSLACH